MPEFDTANPPLSPEEIAAARRSIDPILLPLLNEIRGTAGDGVALRSGEAAAGPRARVTRLDLQRKTKGTRA